jgi:hypothetical protein
MSVFWLNHKLGVGFVGMWLDDFGGFGFVNLVLMLAYLWDHWFEDIIVDIDGYVVLVEVNCYGLLVFKCLILEGVICLLRWFVRKELMFWCWS